MQQLKQILLHKAKIIEELKLSLQNNRYTMLNHLKSIQKQQQLNEVIQKQILSSLNAVKFESKQELEKLYFFSFTVIKSFCKNFQFFPKQNQLVSKIVEMHCKFYQTQAAFEQVDQIKQNFKENTPINETLLKKLILILYQWAIIKFKKTVNKTLNSIQKDFIVQKLVSPIKIQQEFLTQENKILRKDLNSNGKSMNLFSSQNLSRNQTQTQIKVATQKASPLFTEQSQVLFITPEEKSYDLSTRISTSYDTEKSEELIPKMSDIKKRSFSYNRGSIQRQKSVSFVPNINRQIFYGAFNQQFNQIYKNLSDVMDIDSYYLRSFRRQKEDLKDQIIFTRVNEVVDLMVKNMPKVQKSINKYSQQYVKYCPTHIKTFNQQQKLKNFDQISKFNSKSLQKSQRQRLNLPEKLKSEEGLTNNDKQIEKLFKNSKTNRLKQRNKSFNQRISRKSSHQKNQIQTKFPAVYSPQFFYPKQDIETQKVIAIHQKLQNFTTSINKMQNKGLIRYKLLNRDREKHAVQEENFTSQKQFSYNTDLFQTKKLSQFQVANIRKLLRIRQKERITANKTPLLSSIKQQKQDINDLMVQVKAMDSQRSKELSSYQKANKYQVFLSTLNRSDTKSGFKSNQNSPNIIALKNSDYCLSARKKQKEFLPKLV